MNRESRTNWGTVVDEAGKPIFVGPPWSIVATAPGQIIWHNSDSGETQIWRMNAHRMTGRATVLGEDGKAILVGLPWRIVSSGDFNSDGKTDILWHNSSSNETQIWLLNDRNVIGRRTVLAEDGKPMFVGLPWRIVGADDFNRDGASDILWHNQDSGEIQIWFMRDHSIARRATVDVRDGGGNMIGLPWRIVPTNLPPPGAAATSMSAPPAAPLKPPFITAGQPIIVPPMSPIANVYLAWDGGPEHPNTEVWVSINNSTEIPGASMHGPVFKQPKVAINLQLPRARVYKYLLKDGATTLATAVVVVP